MPEYAEEYIFALTRALAQAKVLPSATDDITIRVLRDKPSDIVGYLETCKAALPSYFAPPAAPEPVEPAPGDVGYDGWFLRNVERIAGGPTLQTAAAAKGELSSGSGKPAPKSIRRDDPQVNKLMIEHLEAIAAGTIEVI